MDKQPPLTKAAKRNRDRRARQKERRAEFEAIERGDMTIELLPKQGEATHRRKETKGEREFWLTRELPPKLSQIELESRAYRENWATPDGAERVATNALVNILLNDTASDKLKADVVTKLQKIGDSKLKAMSLELMALRLRLIGSGEAPLTFESSPPSEAEGNEAGYQKLIQCAKTIEELDVIANLVERAYSDGVALDQVGDMAKADSAKPA